MYNTLRDAGVVTNSLPEWSDEMNRQTGSTAYSAGLKDNWVKQASASIDDLLEMTGLPDMGANLGRSIGGAIGQEDAGEEIGRGWARMGANMLPLLLPGPGWVGAAGMGLMSAMDAYTATDSPAAGVIGGVTAGIMPKVAGMAGQAALKALGVPAIEGPLLSGAGSVGKIAQLEAGVDPLQLSRRIPTTLAQGALSQLAEQGAAAGLGEASKLATQAATGQPLELSPTDILLNLTLGQAPFAGMYALKGGRAALGGETSRRSARDLQQGIEETKTALDYRAHVDESRKKADIEKVPEPTGALVEPSAMVKAEMEGILAEKRNANRNLQKENTTLSLDELEPLRREENEMLRELGVGEDRIMGVNIRPQSQRVPLTGQEQLYRPPDPETGYPGWRLIRVSDDPANGEYAGKLIGYSGLHEPDPVPGEVGHTFSAPLNHMSEYPDRLPVGGKASDLATGELPIQKTPARAPLDLGRTLQELDTMVGMAKSPADFQAALEKANGVRASLGVSPYSDASVAKFAQSGVGNQKDQTRATLNEARRQVEAAESQSKVESLEEQRKVAQAELQAARDAGDITAETIAEQKLGRAELVKTPEEGVAEDKLAAIKAQTKQHDPVDTEAQNDAEHMAYIYELAGGQHKEAPEDHVAAAQKIVRIRDAWSRSSGRRSDIVTQGVFDREARAWDGVNAGELVTRLNNILRTGAGMDRAPVGKRRISVEELPEEAELRAGEVLAPPVSTEVESVELPKLLGMAAGQQKGILGQVEYLRQKYGPRGAFESKLADLVEKTGGDLAKAGIDVDRLDTELQQVVRVKPRVFERKVDVAKEVEAIPPSDKPQTLPLNQRAVELGLKVTNRTTFTGDKPRFIDLLELGKQGFMEKYRIPNEEEYRAWINLPHVGDWVGKVSVLMRTERDKLAQPSHWDAIDPALDPEGKHADLKAKIGSSGHDLVSQLTRSPEGPLAALARDLQAKYGAALGGIEVRAIDSGLSHATWHPEDPTRVLLNISEASLGDKFLMHELLHGLTMHSLKDPRSSAAIEGMMEHLARSLPGNLKDVLERMRASDWYRGYTEGIREWSEYAPYLKDPHNDMNLLYGLQNADEFLTQGFTNEHVRGILAKTPAAPRGNLWQTFKGFVAEVLGLEPKHRSILEELMDLGDVLMENRNKAMALLDYNKRYFENLGFAKDVAAEKAQSALAIGNYGDPWGAIDHFMSRESRDPDTTRATQELEEFTRGKLPEDTATGMVARDFLGSYPRDKRPPASVSGLLHEMVSDHLKNGRHQELSELFAVLDPEATNFIFAKYRELDGILGALEGASSEGVREYTGTSESARPYIKTLAGLTGRIGKLEERQNAAYDDLHALSVLDPATNVKLAAPKMDPETGLPDPDRVPGVVKGVARFLERTFTNPISRSKIDPLAAEFNAKGMQLETNARQIALGAWEALGRQEVPGMFGGTKHVISDDALKVMSNLKLEKVVSQWSYQNNEKGKKTGVQMLPPTDPDVAKLLSPLSPEEQRLVKDFMGGVTKSTQVMQKQILGAMTNESVVDGTAILKDTPGMEKYENRKAVSTAMLEAMQADWQDPQQAAWAQAKLDQVMGKVNDPDAALRLMKYMQVKSEILKVQEEYFANNPAWMTAQRHGKFDLTYREGGEVKYDQVNSEAEARAVARGGEIMKLEPRSEYQAPPPMNPKDITRLEQLQENLYEMLRPVHGDEVITDMRAHDPVQAWKLEQAYQSGAKVQKLEGRRLGKGAAELDWLRNHIEWINNSAHYWARRQFKAEGRGLLQDPMFKERPDLVRDLRAHQENMLRPDPATGKAIRGFMSTWFLTGNLGTALVNGSQIPIRGTSEMYSLTGSLTDSWGRMFRALKEATSLDTLTTKALTPDRQWLAKKMRDYNINSVWTEETGIAQDSAAEHFRQALGPREGAGLKRNPILQKAKGFPRLIAEKGMIPFRFVEKINNQAAIYAGFDYWKPKIKAANPEFTNAQVNEMAFQKAMEFNASVNDWGGKANRAIGLFDQKDNFMRNTVMMASSLQSYTIGYVNQAVAFLRSGKYRPAGATPSERYYGGRAFMHMMLAQAAASGVVGLPFVSGALTLVDKAFPDLEIKKNLKGWMNRLMGGDGDNDSILSDMAMMGVPSMLGWDWQSRLSVGNIPGVSEYNGLQPGALQLGPIYALGNNVLKGAQGVARGDFSALTNVLPPIVKKWADLIENGDKVRDYTDKPLYDITPGEWVGAFLGFQPTALTKWNTARRFAVSAEDLRNNEERRFHTDLANDLLKGNLEPVRMKLIARQRDNPEGYNSVEGARKVADAVTELQFPRDLRREGGPEYGKVLRMYNIPIQEPSEVARLQFKENILRRLGVTVKRSAIKEAVAMDNLKAAHPDLSRYELQRLSQAMLKGETSLPEAVEASAAY